MSTIAWSFDDVIMPPKFSTVKSRKDVDPSVELWGMKLRIPVISANMDSVTGTEMVTGMHNAGGVGCLHRFWSVEDNVAALKTAMMQKQNVMVSVGLGFPELERAKALFDAGAKVFVVDVAHGASQGVVEQVQQMRAIMRDNVAIVVGNFATLDSIEEFLFHVGPKMVDGFKVGIGGGSACLTRKVTGCGLPTLSSIIECSSSGLPIIADGGIRGSDDMAKALAAGASAVMLGRLLAGTEESNGEEIAKEEVVPNSSFGSYSRGIGVFSYTGTIPTYESPYTTRRVVTHKKYRGSASQESYESQGKVAEWRAPEGDAFLVPYEGKVSDVLMRLDGGLRSAMSYQNAHTLPEFWDNATFRQISAAGNFEGTAHGKVG